MQPIFTPPSLASTQRKRPLVVACAVVALAHLLVLEGLPMASVAFAAPSGRQNTQDTPVLTTRMIEELAITPAAIAGAPSPRTPAAVVPTVRPTKVQAIRTPPAPEPQAGSPVDPSGMVLDSPAAAPLVNAPSLSESTNATATNVTTTPSNAGLPSPTLLALAQAPAADSATKVAAVAFPPPTRLEYDVKGVVGSSYSGSGQLLWQPEGSNYSARLRISKLGVGLRTWTSKGTLTERGLAPTRFGDKGFSSEIASHFQRDKGIISFSNNAPDVPLEAGAQDHLSVLLQLSALLAADPQRYPSGTRITFQAANARGAEAWAFVVNTLQTLDLPGGTRQAIKLTREYVGEHSTKVEVWLAPDQSYLPIRIKLSETNGDYAELLWSSTEKPN